MPVILHKFRDHQVSADTEILILGTFSPDVDDKSDFFHGRPRNFLWHLLPICYKLDSLKEAPLADKLAFMAQHKIDFADIIHSLEVSEGEEENVDDAFEDSHILEAKDIIALVDTLPNLKAVYFIRKTFNGIPNIRTQVVAIAKHCQAKGIRMCKLETPAKFFSEEKQQQWIDTMILQKTCLRP
jgi:G:T/U-mismatch repair DNA glycosylase